MANLVKIGAVLDVKVGMTHLTRLVILRVVLNCVDE